MVRVEHSASTSADTDLAWKIFTNIFLWRRFADVYGDIEWSSGAPWRVGSRLKIEIIHPLKTTVDHVITVFAQPRCIAWIDHGMGNTMEQWVQFEPAENGGTRVTTWAEITGPTKTVAGLPIKEFLQDFVSGWYDLFCAECDLAARQELQLT
jgi:hypothetical protein